MAILEIDCGDKVFCDDCGADYTASTECGGLLFSSYACCPKCAPHWELNAAMFKETHLIHARCPKGQTFAEFVRSLRLAARTQGEA